MDLQRWKSVFIFAFLCTKSLTCAVHLIVTKCPVTEATWKARSQIVTCESPLVYHCIQDLKGQLMETCMKAYKVKPSVEGGCPWASYHTFRGSIIGTLFYLCKSIGCPQKNDSDYWTSELYKYPICLLHYNETTKVTDSTISPSQVTDVINDNNEMIWGYSTIATTALAVIIIVLLAWPLKRRLHCSKRLFNHIGAGENGENVELFHMEEENRDKDISKADKQDWSDLVDKDVRNLLHFACLEGNMKMVKCLIDDSEELLRTKDNNGCTPFHLAGFSGSLELIQYVMTKGCDIISKDYSGRTLVHNACQAGHTNVVKYLIEQDAKILCIKDNNGMTIFHCAGLSGSVELVQYLIDNGCDVYSTDDTGKTIGHYACTEGHVSLMKHLLEIKEDVIDTKDTEGLTPFHCAGFSGSVELVQYLIDDGSDMFSKSYLGSTIAHNACGKGHVSLMKHLIDKDENVLMIENNSGLTPFHCAGFSGSVELVQHLIDNGCDVYSKTHTGWTIVHYACCIGHMELVKYFIGIGIDFKMKDIKGKSPLQYAGSFNSEELVQYLSDVRSSWILDGKII